MSEANSLLIVDDDLLTTEVYQTLLEKAGYNVILATTTSQANKVLEGIEVDAVVLAYDLPDSGLAWLRHLRSSPTFYKLPVILVSTTQRYEDLTRDNFVWFMEKPRSPQQIVTAVEATLTLFDGQ